ncbi:MAG: AbrB/MazE/SpoVT family DNA-binding domain-containing protein [Rhodospirillales bacterium]|nr:AbrB/MazE/SpoVT family DNA-binding domain-containing protein [Rhodospirillales bacterium]
MRINSKGQVTIPKAIRESASLLPKTEVEISYDGHAVRIVRVEDLHPSRGARLVAHMRGRGNGTLRTEDIMALTRRR